jgi:mannobiose 2-epimerase
MKSDVSMILAGMKAGAREELTCNILPWWIKRMPDDAGGGFYGRIDGRENIIPDAPKGGILNARILWSFSAAYMKFRDSHFLEMATRAREYIFRLFFDDRFGGTYWSLAGNSTPLDTKSRSTHRHSSSMPSAHITWPQVTGSRLTGPLICTA